MGCDGGTIPKRHELVKGPKKVEKADKNAELLARWNYCALSQEKLHRPIVACDLGRLYNKDSILEYLLDKSAERPNIEVVAHIRSIKDIKELNLTDNPEWQGDRRNAKGDCYEDLHRARFICPVVGLEMNGKHKFCFLQTCGCVFSERALREVKTEICHKCGDPFQERDIVILNGNKEDLESLQDRMEVKRAKAKLDKKSKKSKATENHPKLNESEENPGPSRNVQEASKAVSVNNDKCNDSAVPGPSNSSSKIARSAAGGSMKRPLTVNKDKSEVYKSIFTSHTSAKRTKDQSSHWITHTPYHF
ncbi:replication termination factor 2 isoform X2 [Erpetoichthys calabaricus]|nr:replication termination factor 2 isoform X2 [Erpetoichthys calabaricus]